MFKWAKEQKIYDAGFAKGLMLGKAVATRDECERIISLLLSKEGEYWLERWYLIGDESDLVGLLRKNHIKEFIEDFESKQND